MTVPYSDRFAINRTLPEQGRDRAEVLSELAAMAAAEDPTWEVGKCSGTMYCGDHDHYNFMTEAFSHFAHVNILQRDMCPSATKMEAEIIAMTLDMLGAGSVTESEPAGLITTGGSGSISHAMLAYREAARAAGRQGRLKVIKPETAHPAFNKACHLYDLEVVTIAVDPVTTTVRPEDVAQAIDDQTIAIIGSACNYGYGTVDPITELGQVALAAEVGLHVDGCLGGFILPFGRTLGEPIPAFDFSVPGVTTISADTHKYGYAFKGTSVLAFRDKALRNAQYFYLTDWSGGKYCSPGIEGSRSGGLVAATWASLVSLGRSGYLDYADHVTAIADALKAPTFLFSFTADAFDVYHVNDFLRTRGWRLNGQQYPNALHMAVTRPQTQPGVAEAFDTDLAAAVAYAVDHAEEPAKSSAVYGGVAGGMTDEADEFIKMMMADMMDAQQSLGTID